MKSEQEAGQLPAAPRHDPDGAATCKTPLHVADGVALAPSTLADGTPWTAADQAWADQAMADERERLGREAQDEEEIRKALAGTKSCPNCDGTGFDAEPDGFGGAIGGRCDQCNGGGRVTDEAGVNVLDKCEVCGGERGGVPGNENRVDGRLMCDYCHGDLIRTHGVKGDSNG